MSSEPTAATTTPFPSDSPGPSPSSRGPGRSPGAKQPNPLKATHAYLSRHPCGCVTGMIVEILDDRDMRTALADHAAHAFMDGCTFERVTIDEARAAPLGKPCPHGIEHIGSALVEPPTRRADGLRLYLWRAPVELVIAARSIEQAEERALEALRQGNSDWGRWNAPIGEPFVRAITSEDEIPEDDREGCPVGLDDEEGVDDDDYNAMSFLRWVLPLPAPSTPAEPTADLFTPLPPPP